MANILDKYGIKEVADVVFYDKNGAPQLFLDTLKVSTIEQTAETTDATGGKGNAPLITWDYGKDITVTLEDALFSMKSFGIMFGNGTVDTVTRSILKTIEFTGRTSALTQWTDATGSSHAIPTGATVYDETGAPVTTTTTLSSNKKYFITFNITPTASQTVVISANSFPGTYKVVGDTYARSYADGTDEMFQFVINKAKVLSENTITMEADGDPSVFNMNLKVLRDESGEMMQLIKYTL